MCGNPGERNEIVSQTWGAEGLAQRLQSPEYSLSTAMRTVVSRDARSGGWGSAVGNRSAPSRRGGTLPRKWVVEWGARHGPTFVQIPRDATSLFGLATVHTRDKF